MAYDIDRSVGVIEERVVSRDAPPTQIQKVLKVDTFPGGGVNDRPGIDSPGGGISYTNASGKYPGQTDKNNIWLWVIVIIGVIGLAYAGYVLYKNSRK